MKLLVRERREQLGLSQRDVAAQLGVAKNTLAQKELGDRRFTLDELERLVVILHVPCLCALVESEAIILCACTHSTAIQPDAPVLIQCICGAVVLRCAHPACLLPHIPRLSEVCGACTATGGMPVLEPEVSHAH